MRGNGFASCGAGQVVVIPGQPAQYTVNGFTELVLVHLQHSHMSQPQLSTLGSPSQLRGLLVPLQLQKTNNNDQLNTNSTSNINFMRTIIHNRD